MQRIDRLAVTRYGMPVLLLMENAGRAVAETVRRVTANRRGGVSARGLIRQAVPIRRDTHTPMRVVVLCGGGHNGGDGVVAARYLRDWGYDARVLWIKNPRLWEGDVARHYQIARRRRVPFTSFGRMSRRRRRNTLDRADLLIDALLGTGTQGEVRDTCREAIKAMNRSGKPVVAVDIPSGLNVDTGKPLGIATQAHITVTMAAPKVGLLKTAARPYVGRLIVADIGMAPRRLPPNRSRTR